MTFDPNNVRRADVDFPDEEGNWWQAECVESSDYDALLELYNAPNPLNPVEATGSEPIGETCCTCGQEGTFTGYRWIHKEPAHHEFTLSQSAYHNLRPALQSGEAAVGGWECFSDMAYYDLWCVRRAGEGKFGVGYHVQSRAEAEALCDELAALQARIEELEANRP